MKLHPFVTAEIALDASLPASIASKTSVAKWGSVIFCVATAPTPARACGQRDPTEIEDVVIATPNIPVRAHRPAIENVMAYP
jgi:hypothetical protein